MEFRNVLLVDDDGLSAAESIFGLKQFLPENAIHYVASAAEAMIYLKEQGADLIFLDIDLPGTSGFSLASYIESHFKHIPYVFLTGYANFAAESYEYNPVDFLTKPIDLVRLEKTFQRLQARNESKGIERIALRAKQGYVLVEPEQICYIAKVSRKIVIYCKDDKEIVVNSSLDELEVIFEEWDFFRCHQSYIVPLQEIQEVIPSEFGQTYEAGLKNGRKLPVSRSKTQLLRQALQKQGVRFLATK